MKRKTIVVLLSIVFSIFYAQRHKGDWGTATRYAPRADSPAELPPQRWKAALIHAKNALRDKDLATSAAALAYYATLTFFPALLAIASALSFFTDPSVLLAALDSLKMIMPTEISSLFHSQFTPLTQSHKTTLGVAALISLGVLLWTTSGGIQNLIKATNLAYSTPEDRNFFVLRSISLLLTLGLLVFSVLIIGLLVLQNDVLSRLGVPEPLASIFPVLRWAILVILVSLALSFVYRYAPNRPNPRWQWVSWGATAATLIWLAGSALFFLYIQHFSNFNKTYGLFAGLIILMTWFNLSSLVVLLGAQVNHSLEKQK